MHKCVYCSEKIIETEEEFRASEGWLYLPSDATPEDVSGYYHERCLRFMMKKCAIKQGITKMQAIKESLFKLKAHFYGDFKYNQELKRDPYPGNHIQTAITNLEQAIREAYLIEINSV